MSDLSGTQLGRYRLEKVIGTGGFATVYRAIDEGLDAAVAVKVLADNHSLDLEMRERFLDEGRLLRRVKHPALITVHDVGETHDKRPYLVLELAEGGTLHDRLAGTEPGRADLVALADALHDSLAELHAAGIVHRDLSPRNVFIHADDAPSGQRSGILGPDERFAIGDLGLAKDLLLASGVTAGVGTGEFAAPERKVSGGVVSASADIYGASALLSFVASGSNALGPVVEEATRRGRSVDPAARPATIGEWRRELAPLDEASQDEPAGRRRLGPVLLVGMALLAAVGLGALLAGWQRGDDTVRTEVAGVSTEAPDGGDDGGSRAVAPTQPATVVFGSGGLSAGWTDDSWGVTQPFSTADGSVGLDPFGALSLRFEGAVEGGWLVFTLAAGDPGPLSVRANDRDDRALAECPVPNGVGTGTRTFAVSLDALGAADGLSRISLLADATPVSFTLTQLALADSPPGDAATFACG